MTSVSDFDDQRTTCGSDDLTESSGLSYENYPRSRPILTGFRSPREPSGYSPRPPPATPPPAKFVVCESCSRTYRETVINKHVKEFHSKVRCTLCGATVDRYHLRKHQENDCPRRLRICSHCYLQVEDVEFEAHLKCCPQPVQQVQRKERVERNRGLSFKGTIFDEHTKIAESFINIARGHAEKLPYKMLVKAESKSKKTMMPSLEDLMGVICSPNSFSTETENLLAKTFGHDAFLWNQVAVPLQKAFARDQRKKEKARHKIRRRHSRRLRKAASCDPGLQNDLSLKPPRPPAQAQRIRQIHQSVGKRFRDECYHRRFVQSWLGTFFMDKNELTEADIKAEEAIEDSIIDEAIELEMKKDVLRQIPRDRWPSFVEEIKKSRKKWKDLGFSIQDCPVISGQLEGDRGDGSSTRNNKPLEVGKVEIVEQFEDPVEAPYWKLVEGKNKRVTYTDEPFSGGFYKSCKSCHQLFHEDHLEDHTVICQEQKQRVSKNRQRMKVVLPTTRTVSVPASKENPLSVPRPFARLEGHCSSLALSIAPHSKHYRRGKSKYAFITKAGRL